MMTDKLRAAAQAVGDAKDILFLREMSVHDKVYLRLEDAINAIKAALAEPAIKESLTVAEQEPVAWTTMPEAENWCFVASSKDPTGKLEGKWFPLYTAPPRRKWIGLTRTELEEIFANCDLDERGAVAHMVEVKLRNKNT